MHYLKQELLGEHPIDHAPPISQTRGAIALPLTHKGFVVKPLDRTQASWA